MKISRKSWHARLYAFTYAGKLPENLCPYFWKILFGFVVFIPNAVLQLPMWITEFYRREYHTCANKRMRGTLIWIATIMMVLYLLCVFNWILAIVHAYSYDQVLANLGLAWTAAINCIAMGFLIYYLSEKHKARVRDKKEKEAEAAGVGYYTYLELQKREKKPNIFIEYYKAIKGKYCPKIDWE